MLVEQVPQVGRGLAGGRQRQQHNPHSPGYGYAESAGFWPADRVAPNPLADRIRRVGERGSQADQRGWGRSMPVDHVNGVELYWERRGSGPRLLFCNGSGATLQTVRPLLDLVAGKFDLLAWDYRGLGRSGPLTGPYTMTDLATDAFGLLEIAGWDVC